MKKGLAALLSLTLIWTSSSLAEAAGAFSAPASLNPPASLGYISDTFNSSSSQRVILIQDLHAHYGVQKNIAGILQFLAKKLSSPAAPSGGSIPFAVAVEGASGPIDSSVMALFPDQKIKQAAADYLMKEGELTGTEYFAVMRGLPNVLTGVENPTYYELHRTLFRKTLQDRQHLVSFLRGFQADLANLRRTVYSKELRRLQHKLDKGDLATSESFQLKMQLAKTQAEKDLVQVEEDLTLLLRVADLQATETEVRDFGPRLNQFVALCHTLLASNGVKDFDEKKIRELISTSVDYYALALMRNKPMMDNTLALMHSPTQTAVLVAGGFHTRPITQLLREKNISYTVITPNVKDISSDYQELYVKRLNGDLLTDGEILGTPGTHLAVGLYGSKMLGHQFLLAANRSNRGRGTLRTIALFLVGSLGAAIGLQAQTPAETKAEVPKIVNWIRQNHMPNYSDVPKSFQVLPEDAKKVWEATPDPLMRIILNRGLVTYDGAVESIFLMEAGDIKGGARLAQGLDGEKDISAFQSLRGFYMPDDPSHPFQYGMGNAGKLKDDQGWLFRLISDVWEQQDPLTGKGLHWEDWKPIAGENAWNTLYALQLHVKKYGKSANPSSRELKFARGLADVAILMQAADAGGVRYAPQGTFVARTPPDISENYYQISTENNHSWYAAFRMLYEITRDPKYLQAIEKIEKVYLPKVWNAKDKIFAQGLSFNPGRGWTQTAPFATDCQTWGILVYGPEKIDAMFGEGASYWMLHMTGVLSGVFDRQLNLLAVGFTDQRSMSDKRKLASVEWSDGYRMAARMSAKYYASKGKTKWAADLDARADSMRRYIASLKVARNNWVAWPYATGKASDGAVADDSRSTGFGWIAPVQEVLSAASTGWEGLLHIGKNPFRLEEYIADQSATTIENTFPSPAPQVGPTPSEKEPIAAPTQRQETKKPPVATEEAVPSPTFEADLYDHYEGPSWLGMFNKVNEGDSETILRQDHLRYIFHPSEFNDFKGFHIDVKGPGGARVYSLYGHKKGNGWELVQWEDVSSRRAPSQGSVKVEGGAVVVTVLMAEVKASMQKARATKITEFHGQTGGQQNGIALNSHNIQTSVQVEAFSTGKSAARLGTPIEEVIQREFPSKPLLEQIWNSRFLKVVGVGAVVLLTSAWTSGAAGLLAFITVAVGFLIVAVFMDLFSKHRQASVEAGFARRDFLMALTGASVAGLVAWFWLKRTEKSSGPGTTSGEIPPEVQNPDFETTLYDHYDGPSWLGYFKKVISADSRTILDQQTLQFLFYPSDFDAFKGFHIDLKGETDHILRLYSLYGHKQGTTWRLVQWEDRDELQAPSKAKIGEKDGAVVVTIPMSEVKNSMAIISNVQKTLINEITEIHGQTGQQQNKVQLNDRNVDASVKVRAFSTDKVSSILPFSRRNLLNGRLGRTAASIALFLAGTLGAAMGLHAQTVLIAGDQESSIQSSKPSDTVEQKTFKWNPKNQASPGGYKMGRSEVEPAKWVSTWWNLDDLDRREYSKVKVTFKSPEEGKVLIQLLPAGSSEERDDGVRGVDGEYTAYPAHKGTNTLIINVAEFPEPTIREELSWAHRLKRLVIQSGEEAYSKPLNRNKLHIEGVEVVFIPKGANPNATHVSELAPGRQFVRTEPAPTQVEWSTPGQGESTQETPKPQVVLQSILEERIRLSEQNPILKKNPSGGYRLSLRPNGPIDPKHIPYLPLAKYSKLRLNLRAADIAKFGVKSVNVFLSVGPYVKTNSVPVTIGAYGVAEIPLSEFLESSFGPATTKDQNDPRKYILLGPLKLEDLDRTIAINVDIIPSTPLSGFDREALETGLILTTTFEGVIVHPPKESSPADNTGIHIESSLVPNENPSNTSGIQIEQSMVPNSIVESPDSSGISIKTEMVPNSQAPFVRTEPAPTQVMWLTPEQVKSLEESLVPHSPFVAQSGIEVTQELLAGVRTPQDAKDAVQLLIFARDWAKHTKEPHVAEELKKPGVRDFFSNLKITSDGHVNMFFYDGRLLLYPGDTDDKVFVGYKALGYGVYLGTVNRDQVGRVTGGVLEVIVPGARYVFHETPNPGKLLPTIDVSVIQLKEEASKQTPTSGNLQRSMRSRRSIEGFMLPEFLPVAAGVLFAGWGLAAKMAMVSLPPLFSSTGLIAVGLVLLGIAAAYAIVTYSFARARRNASLKDVSILSSELRKRWNPEKIHYLIERFGTEPLLSLGEKLRWDGYLTDVIEGLLISPEYSQNDVKDGQFYRDVVAGAVEKYYHELDDRYAGERPSEFANRSREFLRRLDQLGLPTRPETASQSGNIGLGYDRRIRRMNDEHLKEYVRLAWQQNLPTAGQRDGISPIGGMSVVMQELPPKKAGHMALPASARPVARLYDRPLNLIEASTILAGALATAGGAAFVAFMAINGHLTVTIGVVAAVVIALGLIPLIRVDREYRAYKKAAPSQPTAAGPPSHLAKVEDRAPSNTRSLGQPGTEVVKQPVPQDQPQITDVQKERFAGKKIRVVFWDMGGTLRGSRGRVPGAEEQLKTLADAGVQNVMVSAAPKDQAEAAARSFGSVFVKVYSDAEDKAKVIQDYLTENGISAEEAVGVGDAPYDMMDYTRAGILPIAFIEKDYPYDRSKYAANLKEGGAAAIIHNDYANSPVSNLFTAAGQPKDISSLVAKAKQDGNSIDIDQLLAGGAKYWRVGTEEVLLLITPDQFKSLNPGTVLKSVSDFSLQYDNYVPYLEVGKDKFSMVTRQGVLAYGFVLPKDSSGQPAASQSIGAKGSPEQEITYLDTALEGRGSAVFVERTQNIRINQGKGDQSIQQSDLEQWQPLLHLKEIFILGKKGINDLRPLLRQRNLQFVAIDLPDSGISRSSIEEFVRDHPNPDILVRVDDLSNLRNQTSSQWDRIWLRKTGPMSPVEIKKFILNIGETDPPAAGQPGNDKNAEENFRELWREGHWLDAMGLVWGAASWFIHVSVFRQEPPAVNPHIITALHAALRREDLIVKPMDRSNSPGWGFAGARVSIDSETGIQTVWVNTWAPFGAKIRGAYHESEHLKNPTEIGKPEEETRIIQKSYTMMNQLDALYKENQARAQVSVAAGIRVQSTATPTQLRDIVDPYLAAIWTTWRLHKENSVLVRARSALLFNSAA